MSFYRRKLPHWQPPGAEYFTTFRLAGSLSKDVVKELIQERNRLAQTIDTDAPSFSKNQMKTFINKKLFKKYEDALDGGSYGPHWLKEKTISNIVADSIHHRDGNNYDLYAYCIMSNHVHIVFRHIAESVNPDKNISFPVTSILESLKKYTARRCNKILDRTGQSFWQAESYDHVVRNVSELNRVVYYTLNNPVKAGLIDDWRQWPNTYCKPDFDHQF